MLCCVYLGFRITVALSALKPFTEHNWNFLAETTVQFVFPNLSQSEIATSCMLHVTWTVVCYARDISFGSIVPSVLSLFDVWRDRYKETPPAGCQQLKLFVAFLQHSYTWISKRFVCCNCHLRLSQTFSAVKSAIFSECCDKCKWTSTCTRNKLLNANHVNVFD